MQVGKNGGYDMHTIIGSKIEIINPIKEIVNIAKERLVVRNPEYDNMIRMGKENIIKWKHIPEMIYMYSIRGNSIILPFGMLRTVWKYIKNDPYELKFNNAGDISIKDMSPTYDMFDYQEKAISEIVKAKGGVLVSPCGSGKTICGIEIIRRIGRKALWLCHTGDLLRQAKKDMEELYPSVKIGLTTEGKLEIGEDITISTVQTMSKINPLYYRDQFDVVICDECAHVCSAPSKMQMFGIVLDNIPARVKIGLTATPDRSAKQMVRSMYAYIGTDKNGDFSPMYKVPNSAVKTMPALHEKIEINNGYNAINASFYDDSGMIVYNELIEELSNNEKRTNTIIQNIIKCQEEGRKQVVLSLRVEHCKEILEKLIAKGIKAVICVGAVTAKKRNEILNQKTKWDVLVATYSLLKEGVSIKQLDTLHLATPVKDKSTVVQCAGRIERYLEGKKQPVVYDYVDMDIPYCVNAYTARRRALKSRY